LEWVVSGSCLSQRVLVDGGHFGTPFMGLQAFATRVVVCMQPTAFSIGCHLSPGRRQDRKDSRRAQHNKWSVCASHDVTNILILRHKNPTWPLERHVLPLLWPPSPRPQPPRQCPLLLPPLPLLTRGPSAKQRLWTRRKRRSPRLLPPQVCLVCACVAGCANVLHHVVAAGPKRYARWPCAGCSHSILTR
jgi:hypothetical protein